MVTKYKVRTRWLELGDTEILVLSPSLAQWTQRISAGKKDLSIVNEINGKIDGNRARWE